MPMSNPIKVPCFFLFLFNSLPSSRYSKERCSCSARACISLNLEATSERKVWYLLVQRGAIKDETCFDGVQL